MKKKFFAKIYPATLSELTLKIIITELFNTENFIIYEGFTVDYLNNFYKNFNFSIIIDVIDFINMVRFDPQTNSKNNLLLIDQAYSEMPFILKDSLRNEFLKNWKSPNISMYHSFIQTCISNYNKSNFFNQKLINNIFNTWRNIDYYKFESYLIKIKYNDFYEELRRIEFDFVEFMI